MTLRALLIGLILVGTVPSAARADGFFVPFYGWNFGGDSGQSFGSGVDESRSTFGFSLGWMGAGVFGFEGDFGYAPDFYGKSDVGDSKLFTFAGNLMVGVPFGGQQGFGVRPYGLVGAGVIHSAIDASTIDLVGDEDNKAMWDFGGGVMMFFSNHVGVRGEVRYFRSFEAVDFLGIDLGSDSNNLDFTRGSIGLILRF